MKITFAYSAYDGDGHFVFSTDKKLVEYIKKNFFPQEGHEYGKVHFNDGTWDPIDIKWLLKHGFVRKQEIDISLIEKEVDIKIKESEKEWKKFWDKHPGDSITGSIPYHCCDRNSLIQDEIKDKMYVWA